jgi:hypothetical protein
VTKEPRFYKGTIRFDDGAQLSYNEILHSVAAEADLPAHMLEHYGIEGKPARTRRQRRKLIDRLDQAGVLKTGMETIQDSAEPLHQVHHVSEVKAMMELNGNWNCEVVLFGETQASVDNFVAKLKELLSQEFAGYRRAPNMNVMMRAILNSLVKDHFPGKVFQCVVDGAFDLAIFSTNHDKVLAVNLALVTGAPMQFRYPSNRGSRDYFDELAERTHRVQVLSRDKDSILAAHKRGVRRYKLDKMRWPVLEGGRPTRVQHEHKLDIEFKQLSKSAMSAVITVDRVRSLNETKLD